MRGPPGTLAARPCQQPAASSIPSCCLWGAAFVPSVRHVSNFCLAPPARPPACRPAGPLLPHSPGPVTVPILLAVGIGVMGSQRQKRIAKAALQNAVDTNTGEARRVRKWSVAGGGGRARPRSRGPCCSQGRPPRPDCVCRLVGACGAGCSASASGGGWVSARFCVCAPPVRVRAHVRWGGVGWGRGRVQGLQGSPCCL